MKNTIHKWVLTCTIHDAERRALWGKVFEGATMPIVLAEPIEADLEGLGVVDVYMLDIEALPYSQFVRTCEVLAREKGVAVEQVIADSVRGIPIVAEDVSVFQQLALPIGDEVKPWTR